MHILIYHGYFFYAILTFRGIGNKKTKEGV